MAAQTTIFRSRAVDDDRNTEEAVGSVDEAGVIHRLRWSEASPVGRVDSELRVFRITQHGERELGQALPSGAIHSAGILEGGEAGWMDPDGVVIQAGMILGEEEVGRVEGPQALAAAAALLLLFLPEEAEANRRSAR